MHSECLVMVAGPRSIGPGDNDSRTSVSGDQQKESNLSYNSLHQAVELTLRDSNETYI